MEHNEPIPESKAEGPKTNELEELMKSLELSLDAEPSFDKLVMIGARMSHAFEGKTDIPPEIAKKRLDIWVHIRKLANKDGRIPVFRNFMQFAKDAGNEIGPHGGLTKAREFIKDTLTPPEEEIQLEDHTINLGTKPIPSVPPAETPPEEAPPERAFPIITHEQEPSYYHIDVKPGEAHAKLLEMANNTAFQFRFAQLHELNEILDSTEPDATRLERLSKLETDLKEKSGFYDHAILQLLDVIRSEVNAHLNEEAWKKNPDLEYGADLGILHEHESELPKRNVIPEKPRPVLRPAPAPEPTPHQPITTLPVEHQSVKVAAEPKKRKTWWQRWETKVAALGVIGAFGVLLSRPTKPEPEDLQPPPMPPAADDQKPTTIEMTPSESEAPEVARPEFVLGRKMELIRSVDAKHHRDTAWDAARRLVPGDHEFSEAWSDPRSRVRIGNQSVPFFRLKVVHQGDVVEYFQPDPDTSGYFLATNDSGLPFGIDEDYDELLPGDVNP